jgi:hypothetical protein
MLAIAGRPLPAGRVFDGRSLVPELRGDAPPAARRGWIFTQYGSRRAVRDQRYYCDSAGAFYDLAADPLQRRDLAKSTVPALVAARDKLRAVLASLPRDAAPPFPEYVNAERLLRESIRRHHPHGALQVGE